MLLIHEWWPPARLGRGERRPVTTGPVRAKTQVLPRGIVLAGHSSLQPGNDSGILAAAVGPVVQDFGQSSGEIWNNNGPARRGDYDLLIASESDSTEDQYYIGLADPAAPHGINNLQNLYWLGLEARGRGAEFALFNSASARSNPVDATNRQRMNYYRQWLAQHLVMPVWVVPGELYVQELRGRGLTDDQIFSDQVHLRPGEPLQAAR